VLFIGSYFDKHFKASHPPPILAGVLWKNVAGAFFPHSQLKNLFCTTTYNGLPTFRLKIEIIQN
jgi:hypothetical protein